MSHFILSFKKESHYFVQSFSSPFRQPAARPRRGELRSHPQSCPQQGAEEDRRPRPHNSWRSGQPLRYRSSLMSDRLSTFLTS